MSPARIVKVGSEGWEEYVNLFIPKIKAMHEEPNPVEQTEEKQGNVISNFIEKMIFGGRWIVVPMYLGLLATLIVYTYKFMLELGELFHEAFSITESDLMVKVISLVDISMIGNLVVMITIGSYSIFVKKLNLKKGIVPQWIENITSSNLKIKMGMSLVGVSSIHLLKDFVSIHPVAQETMIRHAGIHIIFLLSTLALAFTDKISHSSPSH